MQTSAQGQTLNLEKGLTLKSRHGVFSAITIKKSHTLRENVRHVNQLINLYLHHRHHFAPSAVNHDARGNSDQMWGLPTGQG